MKKLRSDLFGKEQGFIVPFCFLLFYLLERLSLFYWIRWFAKKYYGRRQYIPKDKTPLLLSYMFPEIWVVANLSFAVISKLIAQNTTNLWLVIILGIYAVERTFEMLIYQINVLFFHKLNGYFFEEKKQNSNHRSKREKYKAKNRKKKKGSQEYQIKSVTRTVLLLLLNMLEYILQFSVVFSVIGNWLGRPEMHIGVIESFFIFLSLDDLGKFSNNAVMSVVFAETLIGVFMNVLCIAYFIGMLPSVGVKEKY